MSLLDEPLNKDQKEPVQLLEKLEDGKFKLCETPLKKLLETPELKDRQLVVLSVVGAFRKGKSFLLNFLLKYLRANGSDKWLTKNCDLTKDSGFKSSHGSTRVTTGILMWPEPFLVGDDLAVLLVDTQGAFDDVSSMQDNKTIFALSTLMSSVQIFNVPQQIQSDQLDYLKVFLHYGQDVQKNCQTEPFQKFLFLIRDWIYPEEFDFGFDGGLKMLKKKWIKEYNSISTYFTDTGCFLMPCPGSKVEKGHTGKVKEIDKEFLKHLKVLVKGLLSTENLVIKKIGDVPITAGAFFEIVQGALAGLQKQEALSLSEHVTLSAGKGAATKARDAYVQQMEKLCHQYVHNMAQEHDVALSMAIKIFDSKTKFGEKILLSDLRKALLQDIDKMFRRYLKINEYRLKSDEKKQVSQHQNDFHTWKYLVTREQQKKHEMLGDRAYDLIKYNQSETLEMKVGFAKFGYLKGGYSEEQVRQIKLICSKIKKEVKKDSDIHFAAIYIYCKATNSNKTSVEVAFRIRNSHNYKITVIDKVLRVYKNWDSFLDNNKFDKCYYCYPKDGFYQGDISGNVQVEFGKSPACSWTKTVGTVVDIAAGVTVGSSLGAYAACFLNPGTVVMFAFFFPIAVEVTVVTIAASAVSAAAYTGVRCVMKGADILQHSLGTNLDNTELNGWLDIVTTPIIFAAKMQTLVSTYKSARTVTIWRQLAQKGCKILELDEFAGDLSAKSLSFIFQFTSMFLQSSDGVLSKDQIDKLRIQFFFYYHIQIDEKTAKEIFRDIGKKLHNVLMNLSEERKELTRPKADPSSFTGKSGRVQIHEVLRNSKELMFFLDDFSYRYE